MAFDFPNSPTLGQAYGNYLWDGEKWTLPNLVDPVAARKSVYAAPFDAMAYSGMQINGSMEVSQENTAPISVPNASSKYVVDGWVAASTGVQTALAQKNSAAPSGFTASAQLYLSSANSSPAGGDRCMLYQAIEGYRISRLAWGTASASPITIGFWIYANRPGNYSGAISNGAGNLSYPFVITVNAAATFEYKTITIPGPTTGTWAKDNTVGMYIFFTMMCGSTSQGAANTWASGVPLYGVTGSFIGTGLSSDTILISGVVVLPGTEAPSAARSPLIMRPYDQELLTCQRYYAKLGGNTNYPALGSGLANTATQASFYVKYPARMRAFPTVTYGNLVAWTGAFITLSALSTLNLTLDSALLQFTTSTSMTTGAALNLLTNNDANAFLALDARL